VKWFHQTIETRFAGLGSWAFQHRLTALGIVLLLCAVSAAPLGSLRSENSMESLFHPTDPARLALEDFRESFGNDELIVIGLMGWLWIPFDFSTMMVGSIALGLVVDDTIHFLHAFNRELERSGDVRTATRHTLLTTGRAMFVTSLTLVAGFLAYTQATLQNLANFGTLTAAVIVLALLADFTFVPALLSILKRVPAR
jgi:predicted RND superfamily exporter protein